MSVPTYLCQGRHDVGLEVCLCGLTLDAERDEAPDVTGEVRAVTLQGQHCQVRHLPQAETWHRRIRETSETYWVDP